MNMIYIQKEEIKIKIIIYGLLWFKVLLRGTGAWPSWRTANVYIYIYTHIHTYIYLYIYIYTYIYTYTYISTHTYLHIHTYIHLHIPIHGYIHINIHIDTYNIYVCFIPTHIHHLPMLLPFPFPSCHT